MTVRKSIFYFLLRVILNFKCYNLSKLLDTAHKTNIAYEPGVFIGELNSTQDYNYMANDKNSGDIDYFQWYALF